ncbi:hypothetical protein FACS189413_01660 [Bacteroidia bacterium]|nr:hypothetical protein FACS189413_01660 [Bacteroidia bacterium]
MKCTLFSIASAFGVEWLSKKQDVREDSAIAALWALGMAVGVICIFLTPGYAPNISAYLFGNILTVTATIRLIGIMLLMSLLTVPQMTANLFTSKFKKIIVYSIFFGLFGCFSGLFLSYYLNVPSGAAIIFVQALLFLLCKDVDFVKKRQ